MIGKAGQRMRNVEKKSAEMAAKVEQARKALANAEQNRHGNVKARAEARSHFHETQQEYFARFPSGCPLDKGAGPAAAAGIKDASGDVVMGDLNDVVIEPPEDADQETKDHWEQHTELEKKLQLLRGEMGAEAAKRRKVNVEMRQPPRRLLSCKQQRRTPQRKQEGRRAFDQGADDGEILSSEQSHVASIFCLQTSRVWVLLQRNSNCTQRHDYHV